MHKGKRTFPKHPHLFMNNQENDTSNNEGFPFFRETLKLAKNRKDLTFDLALSFHFMDRPQMALEILNGLKANETNSSTRWLKLELLLCNRRFVEALDLALELEIAEADDPETTFAINYIRAQAFWGLGQKDQALALIESLSRVRPNYRSIHSLKHKWSLESGSEA